MRLASSSGSGHFQCFRGPRRRPHPVIVGQADVCRARQVSQMQRFSGVNEIGSVAYLSLNGTPHSVMATSPSSGPSGHRRSSCDCDHASPTIYHEIEQASADTTSASEPPYLDSALLYGRRLALQWESINQCPHQEDRPDIAAIRSMTDAIEHLLRMYEQLLAATMNPLAAPRVGSGRPVFLGSLELQGEEGQMVAQQALRHSIARLGDVLKDMEEDSKQLVEGSQGVDNQLHSDISKVRHLMLRLLGRIPKL